MISTKALSSPVAHSVYVCIAALHTVPKYLVVIIRHTRSNSVSVVAHASCSTRRARC